MGTHITNFNQLISDNDKMLRSLQGKGSFVPTLQSDYTIAIVPGYDSQTNASEFQSLLITRLDSKILTNGFKRAKNKLGFMTADFSFTNSFSFSYIGIPYSDAATQKTYTSLVHYYYSTQLTNLGTLRLKTEDWKLPAVYIVNLKTSNVVYTMYDCMFTYPAFEMSPSSNDFVIYSTEVTFGQHREYLFDDYMHRTKTANTQETKIAQL